MVKGGSAQMLQVIEQMIVAAGQLEQAEESKDQWKIQAEKQAVLGLQQQLVKML